MSLKPIIFLASAGGVFVAVILSLRALANSNPYSAHYRCTVGTQFTVTDLMASPEDFNTHLQTIATAKLAEAKLTDLPDVATAP